MFKEYLMKHLKELFVTAFAFWSCFLSENCFAHESDIVHPHENIPMPTPPNSVAGLKKTAKIGDYALLRGQFVRKFEDDIFEFADDSKKAIFVTFEGVKVPQDLSFGYEYFLWGQVIENGKSTVMQALFLSPKMFTKEHNY